MQLTFWSSEALTTNGHMHLAGRRLYWHLKLLLWPLLLKEEPTKEDQ